MTTKHTPGPWRVEEMHFPCVYGARGLVAEVFGDTKGTAETKAANARLIAAAPDLLEALKTALEELHHPGAFNYANPHDAPEVTEYLESVIAKAQGE